MKKILTFLKNKKISLSLHTIVIALGVFLLLLFVCCSSSHSSKIAVVNMSRVYAEAKVFQNIHDEQQAFENEWREQALAEKEKLEMADKELSRKKMRLRKDQFEKEAAALKNKILDFQNQQMAKLDLIRYQANLVMGQVETTMKPMIAEIAEKKKLDFVLSVSNAFYFSQKVDITKEVIKQLDKAFEAGNLPSLQVSLSEGE